MYQIDPRFLRTDGSIRVEAAMAAGREERAAVIGEGCQALWRTLCRIWRSSKVRSARNATGAREDLPEAGTTA